MNSLLIIGGTGFFGKSILDLHQRRGLEKYCISKIIIFSRNTGILIENFPELLSDSVELINGDISSCNFLPLANLVIYAAASNNEVDYTAENNDNSDKQDLGIVNFCKLAPIYLKNSQILYCSSGAVYGKQPKDVEKMNEEFAFQDLYEMSSYKRKYALSKRFAEDQVKKLGALNLKVSIARCFTFYGKYLPKQQQFAIGNFIYNAEQGKPIIVNANHLVYRSYLNADDMVTSLLSILIESKKECPIFNVGSDFPIEIRELAKIISEKYNVIFFSSKYLLDIEDRYIPNIDKLKLLCKKLNFNETSFQQF